MKKITFFISLMLCVFVFTFKEVEAKVLPQSVKVGKAVAPVSSGSTIGVYPKLRGDRKGLIVNFANLQNAKNVSYMLVYKTSVQEEAAMGALDLTGAPSATRELLFATCSSGVCRYHSGIRDARLEVSYTSKNGKKYLKKFKVKV